MEVSVAPDSVTVNMNLALQENATSLPLINFYLDSSNSTKVVGQLAPAVDKLVPGATNEQPTGAAAGLRLALLS